jgi:molybdenum cofactor cytidylyltransferase
VASVIIVTGADADAVSSAARAFATSNAPHMDQNIVHALDYAAGLSASLRAGLAAVPPSASGVFIFLGDMPRVPAAISTKLADAAKLCNILAAAPVHDGRRGHPVLVARSLFSRLLTLRGDEGARRILDELGPALALVRTDDSGVLLDVDEVSDLARVGPKV